MNTQKIKNSMELQIEKKGKKMNTQKIKNSMELQIEKKGKKMNTQKIKNSMELQIEKLEKKLQREKEPTEKRVIQNAINAFLFSLSIIEQNIN